ncbi:hypothetical protein DV737_g4854, partial [Chaetothyriales sp. CBS 132003]
MAAVEDGSCCGHVGATLAALHVRAQRSHPPSLVTEPARVLSPLVVAQVSFVASPRRLLAGHWPRLASPLTGAAHLPIRPLGLLPSPFAARAKEGSTAARPSSATPAARLVAAVPSIRASESPSPFHPDSPASPAALGPESALTGRGSPHMSGGSTAVQPAPATTTASENDAMIKQSKESVVVTDSSRFISRSRNVSGSGRRSARAARAAEAKDPKEPVPLLPQQEAAGSQKKPRSGFLAFLNCCSPSESLASLKEEAAVPAKKAVIQPAAARTERSPEQTEIARPEKEARKSELHEKACHGSSADGEKAALAAHANPDAGPAPQLLREDASHSNSNPKNLTVGTTVDCPPEAQTAGGPLPAPDVNIIAPTPVTAHEQKSAHDSDPQDVDMADAAGAEAPQVDKPAIEVAAPSAAAPVPSAETPTPVPLPPPPPLGRRQDTAGTGEVPPLPEGAVDKQTWLLPPAQPHLQGRKCLILDLDETLVHSSFKILNQADFTIPVEIEGQYHNVYVIKRPGVDAFMKRVGELFEVVVFTASVSKYGDPLLDQLDIHHVVHHRLFRESCYNHQGNYVKDLSQVGRDLKETIIIDNSPTSYIFHPQHAVPISSWFSDAHDNELLDLIPVLEDLAGPQVTDVSLVLDVTL